MSQLPEPPAKPESPWKGYAIAAGVIALLWSAAAFDGTPSNGLIAHAVGLAGLLGLLEGYALCRYFGAPSRRAYWIGLLGGYAGTWIALAVWVGALAPLRPFGYETLERWPLGLVLAGLTLAYWLVAALVAWPLLQLAWQRGERRWARTLGLAALMKGLTLPVVVALYFSQASLGLFTESVAATPTAFAAGERGWVYFLRPPDQVRRVRLDGTDEQLVATVAPSSAKTPSLGARRTADHQAWDLVLLSGREAAVVAPRFVKRLAPGLEQARERLAEAEKALERPLRRAVDLRSDEPQRWRVGGPVGHPAHGIWLWDTESDQTRRLRVITPFEQARLRFACMLPGDRLIFEYDRRLILGYHVPTRRLTRLAQGTAPLAVMPEPELRP